MYTVRFTLALEILRSERCVALKKNSICDCQVKKLEGKRLLSRGNRICKGQEVVLRVKGCFSNFLVIVFQHTSIGRCDHRPVFRGMELQGGEKTVLDLEDSKSSECRLHFPGGYLK
jgi:hypothetical protein